MPERVKIVIPCDHPPQIAGSPHLALLEPYAEVSLHDDMPETREELESAPAFLWSEPNRAASVERRRAPAVRIWTEKVRI